MQKTKVCILGGGLAGLTAGLTLLRHSRVPLDVTILERGHLLGGKASSIPHRDGGAEYVVEHGAHMVFDYPNLLRLLGEVAPSSLDQLEPSTGAWFERNGREPLSVRSVGLPSPLHLASGLGLLGMMGSSTPGFVRMALAGILLRPERLSPSERRRLDHFYFSTVEDPRRPDTGYIDRLGVTANELGGQLARVVPRSTFAGGFASAFSMLLALRLVQQNDKAQHVSFLKGSIQEVLIDPLVRAFRDAGGQISSRPSPVRRVVYDAARRRIERVDIENEPGSPHAAEAGKPLVSRYHSKFQLPEPAVDPRPHSADYYISALPLEGLRELIGATELKELPFFERLNRLKYQATLACQIYYDRMVTPEDFRMMVGVRGYWSVVLDRARIWSKPDHPPGTKGSILVMVGEAEGIAGGENELVEELAKQARETAYRLFPEAVAAREVRMFVHRTGHDAYFKTTAKAGRDRPSVDTPVENLFLAGDWVAHSFDLVNMEGAVVSGVEAANQVLRRVGLADAVAPVLPMSEPGGLVPAMRALLRVSGLMRPLLGYSEVV